MGISLEDWTALAKYCKYYGGYKGAQQVIFKNICSASFLFRLLYRTNERMSQEKIDSILFLMRKYPTPKPPKQEIE